MWQEKEAPKPNLAARARVPPGRLLQERKPEPPGGRGRAEDNEEAGRGQESRAAGQLRA